MATQLTARAGKFARAEFQCELTHHRNGRCANPPHLEEHHVLPLGRTGKTRGAEDEGPTALVCTNCHRRLEHQTGPEEQAQGRTWLWEVHLPDDTFGFIAGDGRTTQRPHRNVLELVAGGIQEPDYRMWQDLDQERQAYEADRQFDAAYARAKYDHWLMAMAIHQLYQGNKFHLLGSGIDGDDPNESLRQYAGEKGIKERAAFEMLGAAQRRVAYLTPAQAERALEHPYRLMRDAGPSIERLAQAGRLEDIDAIFDRAEETGRTKDAIEFAREMAAPPAPAEFEKVRVTGTITLLMGIEAELLVSKKTGKVKDTDLPPEKHVLARIRSKHAYITGYEPAPGDEKPIQLNTHKIRT